MSITFFVPCLNEEENIKKTILEIVESAKETSLTDYEIMIFDDASTDRTLEKVEECVSEKNLTNKIQIRIVKNDKTKGLGFNYVEGAFLSNKEQYIMICGDHSEKKESIVKILNLRGKADMIIPNFVGVDARSFLRKNFSRFFTLTVNFMTRNNIKYYNGNVLHYTKNVRRWGASSSGFGYQAELIVNLIYQNKSFKEVSIKNFDRVKGVSRGYTFLNFLSVTHSILQIFLRAIRFKIWKV